MFLSHYVLLIFILIALPGYKPFELTIRRQIGQSGRTQIRSMSLSAVATPTPHDSQKSAQLERKTFKRFMQVELWRTPELEQLYPLLCSLETACHDVNRLMRRISTDNLGGLQTGIDGSTNSVNIQGEDQKKLDVIANRIMKTSLCASQRISICASEEDDEPCLCSDVVDNVAFSGDFAAVFDPLDGSSNVDSGLPTGTIFGIYKKPSFGDPSPMQTCMQKGSNLLVAGYCLYSAATHLVLTIGTGLHIFTLDDVSGEFFLTRTNVKMPRSGNLYCFNDANKSKWDTGPAYFLEDMKLNRVKGLEEGKIATSRYMGSLVADAHNIILNGGIFGYPRSSDKPDGKLRLLYEAIPIARIVEEAGGSASDGNTRILDLPVKEIHQRTPLFLGSTEEMNALERYITFYK